MAALHAGHRNGRSYDIVEVKLVRRTSTGQASVPEHILAAATHLLDHGGRLAEEVEGIAGQVHDANTLADRRSRT